MGLAFKNIQILSKVFILFYKPGLDVVLSLEFGVGLFPYLRQKKAKINQIDVRFGQNNVF